MKPIQVGLLGIGTVGSGVFNVLQRNQEEIRRRAGRGIEITMVADLDVDRAKAAVGDGIEVVNDARAIIANPDIDIVIELIGGYGIARALVLELKALDALLDERSVTRAARRLSLTQPAVSGML
ncbi:LysR family transcriptional regulator, partial [Acidovorax sp. NPDC077664]|uniref:helix-turn-helix domain-containing protein n=1 Tax=Acidovorax sp. NPDC077664 TaxID=3390544 RepID=UPI003D090792